VIPACLLPTVSVLVAVQTKVRYLNYPLKLFSVFSATAQHVIVKFYQVICCSYLHLTTKRQLLILKHNEIIDSLESQPSDFFHAEKCLHYYCKITGTVIQKEQLGITLLMMMTQ